jgi:transcriptional regulator with XRE-family HTH domain
MSSSNKSIYSHSYRVFLQRFKQARIDAGLSQDAAAKLIGRTQSFISKCERGERRIDVIELRLFCSAFGLEFKKFIESIDKELGKKG